MPRFTFKLPDIGEGIAEAEVVAWHAGVGDHIEEDQPLADMMTDKATVEMTSPVSGTIVEVGGEIGDQIAIGSALAVIEVGEGDDVDPPAKEARGSAPPIASMRTRANPKVTMGDRVSSDDKADAMPALDGENADAAPARRPAVTRTSSDGEAGRPLASPAVRARARALGIDLASIRPAQGDRVRHADLDAFLSYNGAWRPAGRVRADEQVKLIGLRRRIAENMAASKRHIPHFTYVEEIDVTKLEAARADLNAGGGHAERPKLTLLPLLIVALCRTLPDFPMLNARYDDEVGIVTRHGAVHVGIATQTDAGLMVPVIRDAQDRNIWQLAAEIRRLAEAARTGKARPEELSGSTITLSSLGPLGGIASTPVVHRPEVAILAPNRIVERPVIRNGEVAVAKLMNLSLSCDHRVVDGWDAASFVQAMKRLLETPILLFAG